ncbi:MAG: hypothetical protein ACJA2H_001169 [Nitriliruptoraceae bacterium]|jgi:hypothetical protein
MPATTGPSLTVTEDCCGGRSPAWWLLAGVALTQVSPSLTQRRLSSTIGGRFILQLRATDHRQRSESSRMTVELRWLLACCIICSERYIRCIERYICRTEIR